MSIQEILEELVDELHAIDITCNFGGEEQKEADKVYAQATAKLKDLMLEALPKEKEVGEMRYGGCNPDEDRGWNQALTDIKQKVEQVD
jgi:hypothetical protein